MLIFFNLIFKKTKHLVLRCYKGCGGVNFEPIFESFDHSVKVECGAESDRCFTFRGANPGKFRICMFLYHKNIYCNFHFWEIWSLVLKRFSGFYRSKIVFTIPFSLIKMEATQKLKVVSCPATSQLASNLNGSIAGGMFAIWLGWYRIIFN